MVYVFSPKPIYYVQNMPKITLLVFLTAEGSKVRQNVSFIAFENTFVEPNLWFTQDAENSVKGPLVNYRWYVVCGQEIL